MIIASGFTNSAVSLILGLLLLMMVAFHLILYYFLYARIFSEVFKKARRGSPHWWLLQVGLFILSAILLYVILWLKIYFTGEGLLS
jgi:hypothetical protein